MDVVCGCKPVSNPLAVAMIHSEVIASLMILPHCHGEAMLEFPLLELHPLKCLYLPPEVTRVIQKIAQHKSFVVDNEYYNSNRREN